MSCTDKWAHEALDKIFVGELGSKELDRLKAHLAGCPSCTEQYERLTRAENRLHKTEGLPPERLALLQDQVLARAEGAHAAKAPRVRSWLPLLGIALAAGISAFVLFAPKPPPHPDEFKARGTANETAYGVRAFCVEPQQAPGMPGKILGEALPGGKLKCPSGASVQLTYTAPKPANLSVDVLGQQGREPLFPLGGGKSLVASGVDVPLGFSTPVSPQWLSQPVTITAHFEDSERPGKIAESAITVEP